MAAEGDTRGVTLDFSRPGKPTDNAFIEAFDSLPRRRPLRTRGHLRPLAPRNAHVMALIGNGAQAEFQALAMKAVIGIEEVRLHDIDPAATAKTAANPATKRPAHRDVQPCAGCDRGRADRHHLHRGQGVCDHPDRQQGRGRHPHQRDRRRPPRQDRTASRHPLPRRHVRRIRTPDADRGRNPADAGRLSGHRVLAHRAGRGTGVDTRQITLFDGVGFATEDFSALRCIHRQVRGTDFFHPLDILADPDHPRDLFGMLQRADPTPVAA